MIGDSLVDSGQIPSFTINTAVRLKLMDKVICTYKLASGRTLPIDRYLSPITLSNLITLLFGGDEGKFYKNPVVFFFGFFCWKPRLLITSEIKSFKMFLKPKLLSVESLL